MSKRIIFLSILAACALLVIRSFPAAAGEYEVTAVTFDDDSDGAWLGVYLQDVNSDLKEALDLKSKRGALIAGVVDDSPAEEAGLEEEDVVVEFDGTEVKGKSHLTKLVKKHSPGDKITLKLVRDGKEKSLTVVLGDEPKLQDFYLYEGSPDYGFTKRSKAPGVYSFNLFSGNRIGVRIQNLSKQLGEYFGVKEGEGALITEVEEDMPAEKAGLKAGDVIVEVDGDDVEDTEDLIEAISEKEEGDKAEITVIRNRTSKTFEVEVEKAPSRHSFEKGDLGEFKIFTDKLGTPHSFWSQEHSSELEEEMEQLRDEVQELKYQLQELREKLR
jgi:C-terminal processing protease CtpA/Prc